MGSAMALNLIKSGYDLTVWNRSADKCDNLAAGGAKVALTPAEVVRECDITFVMLSDPPAALEVALGPDGAVSGMSAGKGYVDVSTVDADTARMIEQEVHERGGLYIEAPVSGSKGPAEQGQLIFLTAGDLELFEAAAPCLDVMGKARFHLGPVGAGANMKLVVNMVMGTMMASLAEGLALAEESGLESEDLLEVIGLGAIACPLFALKGRPMAGGRYPAAFPLKHQQKDLRLALDLGDEVAQKLPLAAAANQLYIEARRAGHGDSDFSAVREAVSPAR